MSPRRLVLVVDTEVRFRAELQERLILEGYRVEAAADGIAALAAASIHDPDAVVSSYLLPRMNGLELAQALAGFPEPPRMLLVLGRPSEPLTKAAKDLGVVRVVVRPISTAQLVPIIVGIVPPLRSEARVLAKPPNDSHPGSSGGDPVA